jgi:hypothetical protein
MIMDFHVRDVSKFFQFARFVFIFKYFTCQACNAWQVKYFRHPVLQAQSLQSNLFSIYAHWDHSITFQGESELRYSHFTRWSGKVVKCKDDYVWLDRNAWTGTSEKVFYSDAPPYDSRCKLNRNADILKFYSYQLSPTIRRIWIWNIRDRLKRTVKWRVRPHWPAECQFIVTTGRHYLTLCSLVVVN